MVTALTEPDKFPPCKPVPHPTETMGSNSPFLLPVFDRCRPPRWTTPSARAPGSGGTFEATDTTFSNTRQRFYRITKR